MKFLPKTLLLGYFYIPPDIGRNMGPKIIWNTFSENPVLKDSEGPISEFVGTCRTNLIFMVQQLSRFSKTQEI